MSINKSILVGFVGADPEVRFTSTGRKLSNLRLATSRRWTNKDGTKGEETTWHRVVAWGKLAEIVEKYVTKGRQVYVEGRISNRSYETDDGQKRYITEVVAEQVTLLGKRPQSDDSPPVDDEPKSSSMADEIPF